MTILALCPPVSPPGPHSGLRCLIANGDRAMRNILLALSHNLGFEATEASNGAETVAQFTSFRPAVVLLDWYLPGSDGSELIRYLRQDELGRAAHVIVLGRADDADCELQAFNAGANDYLHTPLQARPLAARLDAARRQITQQQERAAGTSGRYSAIDPEARAYAAMLRAVLEHAPIGILATRPDGRLAFANKAYCQAIGISEQRLLAADDYTEVLDSGSIAACRSSNAKALSQSAPCHVNEMLRLANGQQRLVPVVKARYLDGKGQAGLVVMTGELNGTQRLGEALQSEAFEHTANALAITRRDGRILYANQAFQRLLVRTTLPVRPMHLADLGDGTSFTDAVWHACKTRGEWCGEISIRLANGAAQPVLAQVTPLRTQDDSEPLFAIALTDLSDIVRRQQAVEHLAYYDALTDLPNRALFADRLGMAYAQTSRSGAMLAVGYLDLDGFKAINDRHGHPAGDRLLQEVARRLLRAVRSGDTVARLGGDEFALLLPLSSMEDCHLVTTRLLESIAQPIQIDNLRLQVTASIGIAICPFDGNCPEQLLEHADQALYVTKAAGKNGYRLYDAGYDHSLKTRQELVSGIEAALDNGQIRMAYRPIIDLRRLCVVAAEGFLSWHHPEIGIIAPELFMPTVRASALEARLGSVLLHQGMEQLKAWRQAGIDIALTLAFTGEQFLQHNFVKQLHDTLRQYASIPASRLQLRISESALLDESALLAPIIADCRALGVDLAIQGFGVSGPGHIALRQAPGAAVALDRSLIENMTAHEDDRASVEGMIGLARAFQRRVMADGASSAEHVLALLQMGCERAQGDGIAPPLGGEQFIRWHSDWQPDPLWSLAAGVDATSPELPVLESRPMPALDAH